MQGPENKQTQRGRPATAAAQQTGPIRRRRRYQRHVVNAVSANGELVDQRQIMTSKRLAKRSIIGTRVCAPGRDGKYYCGVISAVNTPASPLQPELGGLNITPSTRYSVRFDHVPGGNPVECKAEYSDRDLIGPGFGSVTEAILVAGQKVYLTYNGREIQAEVVQHRVHLDEVDVIISPNNGQEGTMSLTKRIDEVRLLESRKSARLADSDTDFARLADMGSDRKRSTHTMEVPHLIASRKRRPSSSNDSERSFVSWNERFLQNGRENYFMDECSAAMVLMSLSTPPKNPLPIHCQTHYGSWDDRVSNGSNRVVMSSPGVGGTSNSSSSSASWRSATTPSPHLSDEGIMSGNGMWPSVSNGSSTNVTTASSSSGFRLNRHPGRNGSSSSSPKSVSDEGIALNLDVTRPRKRVRCKTDNEEDYEMSSPNSSPNSENTENSENSEKAATVFKCVWRERNVPCGQMDNTWEAVAEHVLRIHMKGKRTYVDEEDFYIIDETVQPECSPPTKSHWDMVRPRSEDPEFQKEVRLAALPVQNNRQIAATVNPQNIIIRDVYPVPSTGTPNKQFKPSQRPIQSCSQPHNISVVTVALGKMQHAPRRVRGETKKCRKVYGMDNRGLWCTQCKWKKACTRFND